MESKKYQITLNERQLKALSYACNEFSRLICGQDWSYQNLFEEAWEKRCKEATGKIMDKQFEGGWHNMRADAEALCKQIKSRFWGLAPNAMHGIYYDETADVLFDIYQVLRHQLWLDRPEDERSIGTVDAYPAMQHGTEELITIKKMK
ncbi:MAG: hypothetical protein IJR13_07620 [Bacteroidales bacterium]|nr:hypothetical protein [Bacteroidales bacterium]